jgi:4-diphosphocytidyl-2-C-methyl-D-erythritol kinase
VILRAPAKINLHLQVLGRRPDGYHDLVSLMAPVSLFDELEIEPLPQPRIVVEGGPPGLPAEKNLAWKAARALAPHAGTVPGARIRLTKGAPRPPPPPPPPPPPRPPPPPPRSSDAAAVLQALNALWDCDLPESALSKLAAGLGADVPFFLHGGPGVVRGAGERFTPAVLPDRFPPFLAILQPDFEMPTALVYQKWDILGRSSEREDPSLTTFLAGKGPLPLRNDLEAAAFALRPELREIKAMILEAGAEMALMSGSGSCFWAAWSSEKARGEGEGPLTKRLKFYMISAVRGVPGQRSSTASQEDEPWRSPRSTSIPWRTRR